MQIYLQEQLTASFARLRQKMSFSTEVRRCRVSTCYVVHEGRGEQRKQRKRDKPKRLERSVFMNN